MMNVRQKMNGRYFAERKIEASLFDGEERYKKSGAGQMQKDGEEAGENERLADFENWLMAKGRAINVCIRCASFSLETDVLMAWTDVEMECIHSFFADI